ncbi:MAG: LytR/AlgR family response regulator transcription factor [Flavobacteriales bacterium]
MKTIIVDDRNSIREFIVQLLDNVEGIEIVGEAENVENAISIINEKKPELILLDIQMPDGNGFEVIEGLTYSNYKVIFITSHEEFAIKAFKYSALDYVVKPIDPEVFYQSIEKAKSHFSSEDQQLKIKNLIENLSSEKKSKNIVLNTQETVHVVNSEDITRCESDGSYTIVYLEDRKLMMSKKLKDFEELLSGLSFYRSHRSHLVNLKYVDRYEKRDGGYIMMKDESSIPLSSAKKDEFFELLIAINQ